MCCRFSCRYGVGPSQGVIPTVLAFAQTNQSELTRIANEQLVNNELVKAHLDICHLNWHMIH
jgi:hypothetical protein